jgi:hypothetical protein
MTRRFSYFLVVKVSNGLKLSQTAYSRSVNNLQGVAAALQNAEDSFYLQTGALLTDNGEFDDLRSFFSAGVLLLIF